MSQLANITHLPAEPCSIISGYLLHIMEFDVKDQQKVARLSRHIRAWPKVDRTMNSPNTRQDAYRGIFSDVDLLVHAFATWHTSPVGDIRFIVAYDPDNRTQGLMIYNAKSTETSWHILFLLSSPWNVLKTAKRCYGTGTALIHRVTQRAKENPKIDSITLQTDLTAREFYTSLGFQRAATGPKDMVLKVK